MGQRGFDLSTHLAQQLSRTLAEQHDLVLVMDSGQQRFMQRTWRSLKRRVCRLGAWRDENVPDPYGLTEDAYAASLACIEQCVADWEQRWFLLHPERLRLPANARGRQGSIT